MITKDMSLHGFGMGLGLAQDVHFFYMRSHLSALQSCALIFSTNLLFSHLRSALQNLVFEMCRALKIFQFSTALQ